MTQVPTARQSRGKVLVVTNDFPPRRGGIESFVSSLCAALPSRDVVVYTAQMDESERVDRRLEYPVVRAASATLLPTRSVAREVAAVARGHGCDRVVFGAAAPLGLLATGLARAGIRRSVGLTHGHEVWWAKTPGTRRLLRRVGDTVDVLTYVSDYCRREISPALSADAATRMVRLSPGVDLDRFHPGVDGTPWRTSWHVGDRPVVLSASRLVARKGQDVLVAAWPQVLASCPEAVLVVVGDGPMRGRLERAVRRRAIAGSVRLVSGVPWNAMPALYAAAEVFVLPCRTRRFGLEPEAFGMVSLEAAASGLPVVLGSSGGAPETLLDGTTGHVVDPRDRAELAARITTLLRAPEEAAMMGRQGRAWVGEHYAGRDGQVFRSILDLDAE